MRILPGIKVIVSFIICASPLLLASSCIHNKRSAQRRSDQSDSAVMATEPVRNHCNSIYHWKTTFDLNESELAFLENNEVHRIYVRLFDVDVDSSPLNDYIGAVPVGTTSFKYAVPDTMEVVPAVFITTRAIMSLSGDKDTPHSLAEKIYTRVRKMASYNRLGSVNEIQLDCDWTASTQEAFFELCQEIKQLAEKEDIIVSATIRLHQLRLAAPPVERGVLMVYNTGAIRRPGTKNSILEVEDVESYMTKDAASYRLPLDFAYPVFGWGVLFRGGAYQGILHHTDYSDSRYFADNGDGTFRVKKDYLLEGHSLWAGDVVRLEYPSPETVKTVAALISSTFKNRPHSTILYHLDLQNLSRFSENEISSIYSY